MVKHTQAIYQFLPTNCLSVFDHFVGLAVKGLTVNKNTKTSKSLTNIKAGVKYKAFDICCKSFVPRNKKPHTV